MSMTVVRYRTKAGRGDENQALIEKVFAELDGNRPDGLRYAAFRLADGVSFVHVAVDRDRRRLEPAHHDRRVLGVPPGHR